ncbi:hypothetical protein BTW15_22380 [Pseudomonas syringae pv. tomato]|uniref:Uncharacterized protein n=2 Tax=Pseudomonas syringae group TaxID=136849 RepID=A0AAW4DUH5_PSESX|nr:MULTISPECIES: hypothetical protein [Pseudomonas syringae group]AVI84812.1 hypothetical protein XJ28_14425 [Pseudomonas syringae pv. tomato]EEB57237.1 hypothetical protein PSPTOT1_2815 [Pseudomonas syringae pv. tomato T1]KGK93766.1 hypothetical protein NB04_19590 [Pseudomonas syringae pv. tomato]KPW27469.1 Uncharacterized protein ALO87_02643 [Pseudomonas syringae pv. apii]KUR39792.1 hypothetical protein PSTA9_04765 [Pseudomonas syringae pv. tomato]
MPALVRSDLKEKYEWKTSEGDNPDLIHEDAKHLSRREGYEMLPFLNKIGLKNGVFVYGEGNDITKESRLTFEWMLRNHFKSTAPGREKVIDWINDNFAALAPKHPR